MTVALLADLEQLHAEAAGVMKVVILRRRDVPALYAAASSGVGQARALLMTVDTSIRSIEAAPESEPILCVSCPRALRSTRYCFAVVLPDRVDLAKALAFGVCERCGPGLPAIKTRAVEAIKRIWPESRSIAVTDAKGHA